MKIVDAAAFHDKSIKIEQKNRFIKTNKRLKKNKFKKIRQCR